VTLSFVDNGVVCCLHGGHSMCGPETMGLDMEAEE